MGWLHARGATLASVWLISCSLVSPSEDSLNAKDSCAVGTKRCAGKCVAIDQPATGCGNTSCDACALDGAESICVAGQCRVGACEPGRADCDGAPANGCEVTLASDTANCGVCGKSCGLSGTKTVCSAGKCSSTGCEAGFTDCNGNASDGCEADLAKDPKNCGARGAACQLPNAIPGCSAGACTVAACVTGKGDCDGKLLNGCEADLATDSAHCGACGVACEPSHGSGACSVGGCEVTSCDVGWADCNGKVADGCEADLANDPKNCSACGVELADGQVCKSGVPALGDAAFLGWLNGQNGGWCDDQFTKFVNLCGTTSYCAWDNGTVYPGGVMFCCDPTLMRAYPGGMAVDVGFHWDGSSSGDVLDAGADCEGKRLSCTINKGELGCFGPGDAISPKRMLPTAGRFLMSYRVSSSVNELWLNGVLVGTGPGSTITPELAAKCGSGFNLGQRISYWWEAAPPGQWLRFAPFFFHLKDQVPAAQTWTLDETIKKTPHSVMLFDDAGVSGDSWTDTVASKVGLVCGGKQQAETEGWTVPCAGKKWVSDVALQCL